MALSDNLLSKHRVVDVGGSVFEHVDQGDVPLANGVKFNSPAQVTGVDSENFLSYDGVDQYSLLPRASIDAMAVDWAFSFRFKTTDSFSTSQYPAGMTNSATSAYAGTRGSGTANVVQGTVRNNSNAFTTGDTGSDVLLYNGTERIVTVSHDASAEELTVKELTLGLSVVISTTSAGATNITRMGLGAYTRAGVSNFTDIEISWVAQWDRVLVAQDETDLAAAAWPFIAAAGLNLDSIPSDNRVTESRSVTVSTPAVAPTTGNTEIKLTDDSGQAATVDSVTGSDPYVINYTFPRTTAALFDSTGYPIYVEVAAENVTSNVVPFLPVSTQRFIDLDTPVEIAGTYGVIYAGATAATGDQRVHDIVTTSESIPLDADGAAYGAEQDFWAIRSQPATTQTATFYLIQANGTVDVEDTITFLVDTTAPILSLPTGTETGSSTAAGTVTTDEDNGTLYFYASINSSEVLATIKSLGNTQAVNATGLQNVNFSGLAGSTVYYAHYVHTDDADNDSNVQSSTSFTTEEAPVSESSGIVVSLTQDLTQNLTGELT